MHEMLWNVVPEHLDQVWTETPWSMRNTPLKVLENDPGGLIENQADTVAADKLNKESVAIDLVVPNVDSNIGKKEPEKYQWLTE